MESRKHEGMKLQYRGGKATKAAKASGLVEGFDPSFVNISNAIGICFDHVP